MEQCIYLRYTQLRVTQLVTQSVKIVMDQNLGVVELPAVGGQF